MNKFRIGPPTVFGGLSSYRWIEGRLEPAVCEVSVGGVNDWNLVFAG